MQTTSLSGVILLLLCAMGCGAEVDGAEEESSALVGSLEEDAPASGDFDCRDPSPSYGARPERIDSIGAPLPALEGGTVVDGRYETRSVTYFDETGFGIVATMELRNGSYIRSEMQFDGPTGSIQTGFTEAGSFNTTDSGFTVDGVGCTRSTAPRIETWEYSATPTTLEVIKEYGGLRRLESYERVGD